MFKFLLITTLIVASLASYNFDLDDVTSIEEEDMHTLYDVYMQYLAPRDLIDTEERYAYFREEVLEIVAHNNDPSNTWKKGITQFTGMTMEELRGTTIKVAEEQACFGPNEFSTETDIIPEPFLPAAVDWRRHSVVTSVKSQLKCGSCWSFAATSAIEAHTSIQNKVAPTDLSQQQLVDCAGKFKTYGCSGGLPSRAFEYVKHAGGIQSERDYPYVAKNQTCTFDQSKVVAKVPSGSFNITSGDEKAIARAVATVGPVTISFHAIPELKSYKSGIYVSKECKNGMSTLTHDVLIVGYDRDPQTGMDYWIIKNSWGTKFGEEGYFRMQKGVNMCGVAMCASYPLVK